MPGDGSAVRPSVQAVSIRPLREDDLGLTLRWRNDPASRSWFKTSAIIDEASHRAWFARTHREGKDLLFFVEGEDGAPVGQGSIYNIDRERNEAEVGRFLSDPGLRGSGLFRRGLVLMLEHAFGELALERVYLEVLDNNDRAIRLYSSVGFAQDGGSPGIVRMTLPRDRFLSSQLS